MTPPKPEPIKTATFALLMSPIAPLVIINTYTHALKVEDVKELRDWLDRALEHWGIKKE